MPSRRWILLRLPLLLGLAGVAVIAGHGWIQAWMLGVENIHSWVKYALFAWHAWMLHAPRDLALVVLIAGAAALPSGGRAALVVGLGGSVLALGLGGGHPLAWVGLGSSVVANLGPWVRLSARAARIPGVELVLPLPLLRAVVPTPSAWARAAAAVPVALVFSVADAGLGAMAYHDHVLDWSDALRAPTVEVLDRSAFGARSDFHDLDLVPAPEGPRVVVVAESARRLSSYGREPGALGSWPLPEPWSEVNGLVMDSETDPVTGTTWFLDGPRHVRALRWDDGAWVEAGRSPPLPFAYTHAYTRYLPERERVVLVSVNARAPGLHPVITSLRSSDLAVVRAGKPLTDDRRPLPTVREIAWLPTLGKLVLAPDFGDRLYLVDPDTLRAEPWVALPAMDGKMEWVPELGRLAVALPSQRGLWLIDPASGEVDRVVPTQLGVRAFGVDAARGLLVTASVVTGQIVVSRLDGEVVRRIGTIMPMVRELRLWPETGEVYVTAWSRLYRARYAEPS